MNIKTITFVLLLSPFPILAQTNLHDYCMHELSDLTISASIIRYDYRLIAGSKDVPMVSSISRQTSYLNYNRAIDNLSKIAKETDHSFNSSPTIDTDILSSEAPNENEFKDETAKLIYRKFHHKAIAILKQGMSLCQTLETK